MALSIDLEPKDKPGVNNDLLQAVHADGSADVDARSARCELGTSYCMSGSCGIPDTWQHAAPT